MHVFQRDKAPGEFCFPVHELTLTTRHLTLSRPWSIRDADSLDWPPALPVWPSRTACRSQQGNARTPSATIAEDWLVLISLTKQLLERDRQWDSCSGVFSSVWRRTRREQPELVKGTQRSCHVRKKTNIVYEYRCNLMWASTWYHPKKWNCLITSSIKS